MINDHQATTCCELPGVLSTFQVVGIAAVLLTVHCYCYYNYNNTMLPSVSDYLTLCVVERTQCGDAATIGDSLSTKKS